MNKAEYTLLSYLIFNPNFYLLRASEITEDIFTTDETKRVLNAIKTLLEAGKNVNTITVSDTLNYPQAFDFVTSIIQHHVFSDIEDIINHLVDTSKERMLGFILADAMGKISSGGWQEATSFLSQKITELNEKSSQDFRPIKFDFDELIEKVEMNRTAKTVNGIGTGITKFDKFSGGLQPSDLVILAGRTSMGKTSLSLTIGRNSSVDFKVPTAIFSLEMSNQQITARAASMESSISSKKILNQKLEHYEVDELKASIGKVYNSKLFIANCSNKIQNILSSMIGYILKEGVRLFIVDYLQLVTLNQKGIGREQEVGQIARIFKNFAKENNVCIICLSQLKRGENGVKEPSLSDLRDSGQIEEAADVVMFIHRPEYYNIDTFEDGESSAGKAEMIIAKGRNIGIGRFRMLFIASLTKFADEPENQNTYNSIQPSNDFI